MASRPVEFTGRASLLLAALTELSFSKRLNCFSLKPSFWRVVPVKHERIHFWHFPMDNQVVLDQNWLNQKREPEERIRRENQKRESEKKSPEINYVVCNTFTWFFSGYNLNNYNYSGRSATLVAHFYTTSTRISLALTSGSFLLPNRKPFKFEDCLWHWLNAFDSSHHWPLQATLRKWPENFRLKLWMSNC